MSVKILYSIEANQEAAQALDDIKHYVSIQGNLVRVIGNESYLTFYNMTRRDDNKAKRLSNDEKKELLSLSQEKLSISLMTKLFSKHSSKQKGVFKVDPPKFNVRDTFKLEAGEYINEKEVETTVGSFLFNKIMIEGMLEPIIPNGYYNEVINKNGFSSLIDKISEGLMMERITVNPTLIKWLKQYEFYGMKACTLFSPSYSEGLLRRNTTVLKEKDKILKSKKIETTQDMSELEDKLVDSAKNILADDTGMTLFDSGARGSFDNDYKNMNLMLGPVAVPGSDGKFDMVTSNYIDGLQKEDLVACGNVVVNSAYPKAVGTQAGGYLTKQYYAAYQSIQCDDDGTDCGTTLGLDIVLTEDDVNDYLYQNIMTKKGPVVLTNDNKSQFIGKRVTIRSSMFCKSDKICSVCAGRRFYMMKIKNIGLTSGRVSNTLLNASMKNFHNAKVKFDEVNVNDLLIN